MSERPLHLDVQPLPPIQPGEVLRRTVNFQVATTYKPGLEGKRSGERFFIEPLTDGGISMLLKAAKAHNIFNFTLRQHPYNQQRIVPMLRADYIATNVGVLLHGDVQIPQPGKDTIPSPDRMESCLAIGTNSPYTFADNLPPEYRIPNPATRELRLLQAITRDDIPERVIHSADDNPYYKVRKGFWHAVGMHLYRGLHTGEFEDPALVEKIYSFLETYGDEFMYSGRLTTPEDILAVNGLINRIWNLYGNESITPTSS